MKNGLMEYEGKKVRITDIDEDVFIGKVSDYIYPEDNEPKEEAIILDGLIGSNGINMVSRSSLKLLKSSLSRLSHDERYRTV